MNRFLCLLAALCFNPALALATVINFAGWPDSTILTNQYASDGVTFSNTIILTAGLSLNEFEFPPYSGSNVASDNGGPITIDFSSPAGSVSGYLTYLTTLTLDAYSTGDKLVDSVTSPYNDNLALSGDPGSSPNELLTLTSGSGISSVTITGYATGGSFTLGELVFTPITGAPPPSVPEPSAVVLCITGLLLAVVHRMRRRPTLPRLRDITAAAGSRYSRRKAGARMAIIACAGVLASVMAANADAQMGAPTAQPMAINVNTATPIVVRAIVSVPNLIAGSVNVQLVDANGNALAVLGSLNDSGLDGDLIAGDGIYGGTITLNEAQTGTIYLRVSAAQLGALRRTASSSVAISVLPAGLPTQPYPTDLGQTGVDPVTGAEIITDEFIACFSAGTPPATVLATISSAGGTAVGRFPISNCYQVELPAGSTAANVDNAISTITTLPGITYAEPEYVDQTEACSFPTCTDTNSLSYQILNLAQAQTVSTGSRVLVAVIDSGISPNTDAALLSLMKPVFGWNFTSANGGDPANTNDVPQFPHGTWVSGIIAGTAPSVAIVPYKVCIWNPNKSTNDCDRGLEAEALEMAIALQVQVVNMSLGSYFQDKTVASDIATAAAKGILVAAAAGNDGVSTPFYPASYPGALSVGGVNVYSPANSDATDTAWTFNTCSSVTGLPSVGFNSSNWGPTIAISAPSVCIETNGYNAGTPAYCTGTSCATPFVAGTAALIFQQHPSWRGNPGKVYQQLVSSAQPIYLYNASNTAIPQGTEQNIGPRLDPLAAVGAMRVTELGFDDVQLMLNVDFGIQAYPNQVFLGQGIQFGSNAPCEARANLATYAIIQPCVRDYLVTPQNGQQDLLFFQLQGIEDYDFDADLNLTLPGLTFVPNSDTGSGFIDSTTLGFIDLFGFAGGQHSAGFTVQYQQQ